MKEYAVKITELSEKIVYVEAKSRMEAEVIAEENWNKNEYIFDADDFVVARFTTIDETEV